MLGRDGRIIEKGKEIGTCSALEDVDFIEDRCPQGYQIKVYLCKRCRHFRSIE